jgi:streptogramin lyase
MTRRIATLVSICLLLAPLAVSCGGERDGVAPLTEEKRPPRHDPPPPVTVRGRMTPFPIPAPAGSFLQPQAITTGADGQLWFTIASGFIGSLSPSDGSVSLFPLPFSPQGLALGGDGNVWFGTPAGVAHLTEAGTVHEVLIPGLPYPTFNAPMDITVGADGDIWALGSLQISRVTPDGDVTSFPLPTPQNGSGQHVAAGPDGNIWYTRSFPDFVCRVTPRGAITEFPAGGSVGIFGIAGGHDGNVWFTRAGGNPGDNAIDRVTPDGVVSRVVQLPDSTTPPPDAPDNMPLAITAGPDGNMYYTTYFLDPTTYIGGVTSAGALTRYEIPELVASFGITSGPDGNVWFTDNFNPRIWRLDPLP